MNEDNFLRLAEEILETEEGALKMSDQLDDVDWDSLADLAFIADADSKLGITINPNELKSCETLADVYSLVSA